VHTSSVSQPHRIVTWEVVNAEDLAWQQREPLYGQQPRLVVSITDRTGLTQSRAQMWRYPSRTRDRRHVERAQEEVFVPLRGTLTVLVDEPPHCVSVRPGGAIIVHPDTPLQVCNATDEEILFFAYGAPPITGNTEFLEDAGELGTSQGSTVRICELGLGPPADAQGDP
jgi:mannose-6-phosphate isomerase-like protein (cupin superfamily)